MALERLLVENKDKYDTFYILIGCNKDEYFKHQIDLKSKGEIKIADIDIHNSNIVAHGDYDSEEELQLAEFICDNSELWYNTGKGISCTSDKLKKFRYYINQLTNKEYLYIIKCSKNTKPKDNSYLKYLNSKEKCM